MLPRDHARSRANRWNEDGLPGLCDRHQRIAFALALWNGRDPFLKERLFGLSNHEGNHGEDVKKCYFYLDNAPRPAHDLVPKHLELVGRTQARVASWRG